MISKCFTYFVLIYIYVYCKRIQKSGVMKNWKIYMFIAILNVFFVNCSTEHVSENILEEKEPFAAETEQINLLLQKANSLVRIRPDSTILYAKRALELSQKIEYAPGTLNSYLLLGASDLEKGNYDQALIYYELCLENTADELIRAKALRDIGLIYFYKDQSSVAILYLEEARPIFEKYCETKSLTRTLTSLGNAYGNFINPLRAISFYHEALDLAIETNDEYHKAIILNNIGYAYYEFGNTQKAAEYYDLAYKDAIRTENMSIYPLTISNIAQIYIDDGKFDQALAISEEGINNAQLFTNKRHLSYLYENIANANYHLGNYNLALNNFNKVVDINQGLGNKKRQYLNKIGIGNTYFKLKENAKAISYLNEALDFGNEINDYDLIKGASEGLSVIYKFLGRFEDAYHFLSLSNQMVDSISEIRDVKRFTQVAMQYDFDKKENEQKLLEQKTELENKRALEKKNLIIVASSFGLLLITILVIIVFIGYRRKRRHNLQLIDKNEQIKEQNAEIEKSNEELRSLNNTKNKFFSIIAHDLKAPFNSILGFSELIAEDDEENPEKLKKYGNIIYNSAKNSFWLLENLLSWSQIQVNTLSVKYEEVNFNEVVYGVVDLHKASAIKKKITVEIDVDETLGARADKNMITLIIRNFLSNAIKFSDSNDTVKIVGKQIVDKIQILVSDTGVGIKAEDISMLFVPNNFFSTPGTANETGTGLGLNLCQDFIIKHHGRIWCESELGKGSSFYFEIPIDGELLKA